MKILCLGNEFVEGDGFAKEVGRQLKERDYDVINIKDSFELLNYAGNRDIVIVDVVEGLGEVQKISVEDLKENKIMSAHDFDAGFFLKLLSDENIKIIGIPSRGDVEEVVERVRELLEPVNP
jgi:hydrogenase maturation protease